MTIYAFYRHAGAGRERLFAGAVLPPGGSHATASITFDTYSHAIPAMQEEDALIAGLVLARYDNAAALKGIFP